MEAIHYRPPGRSASIIVLPSAAPFNPASQSVDFGLHLIEKLGSKNTEQPITLNNQGRVTTSNGVNALQLTGDGGSISYSGDGTISNTNNNKAALFSHNMHGNASIAPGADAISGATGINASTTGPGILTISTGSGLVTGTAADGIFATTGNGALNVTVGSGGVTSQGNAPAIDLTSVNGNITVTANGNVSSHSVLTFPHDKGTRGILATSNGRGNIVIDGSGTLFGQDRAIYALEGDTGLGGITITGTGDVFSASGSTIRAEIDNAADLSNIIVDRSGEIIGVSSGASIPGKAVSSSLHVITKGTGNIIVAGGADAAISHGLFGVAAVAFGRSSSGSIDVSTGADSTLQAGGTGIFAGNSAFHIPIRAFSTIAVTNNGTINSGALPNPVGRFPSEGGGAVATPAAILAGYDGRPVFEKHGSGRYTSCGVFGCTTLTPNPKVNGTVSVVNNGQINAAGGDGIFAFNFGNGNVSVTSISPITVTGATAQNGIEAFSAEINNISVSTAANVTTSNGSGIQTTSAGTGTTTINVLASTTQGRTSGINATAAGGAIQIDNWATIQNLSGQPGSSAVATSGSGNATLINYAGGVVTGIVSMTGSGSNNFINAGIWNTLGTSTFGYSDVTNGGTINIFGPTTFRGLTSLTNSGTLNLAAGGTIGTLTLPGNLAFQSGALYVVALAPPTSSVINVGGTASLAGTVQGVVLPGAYAKGDTFTILQAGGGLGGTFSGFIDPGFSGTFTYTPSDALLTLTAAKLGAGGGLNANQQNVATAINNFFNSGGTLTPNFAPVFGLTGGNLGNALSQISGEVAADAEHGAFNIMTEFLNLMLDPFVEGRLGSGGSGVGGGQAIGFVPDEPASLPPDVALAYAAILKAPPSAPFEQRWTTWGTAYGGANLTNGNSAVGSSNVSAQTYGFAAGMDYHYSPDTTFGFALGGGGTDWGLATGGTGRSDAFQTGVYGITRSGPAYLAAALAFANHWMTTNRVALGDQLTANFDAQSYGARLEGGYRYAVLPTLGVTPYAALQAQDFHTPSYSETDLTGGGFGLSYAAMNATDVRTELGSRFDAPTLITGMPLILRARLAWVHDFVSDPALSAAFESLPGTNFIVNGAPIPQNSALTSAGAEFFLNSRLTLLIKFDGEFAPGSQTYAGSGTLRYIW